MTMVLWVFDIGCAFEVVPPVDHFDCGEIDTPDEQGNVYHFLLPSFLGFRDTKPGCNATSKCALYHLKEGEASISLLYDYLNMLD